MTRTRWIISGAVTVGLLGGGAGVALATGTAVDDDHAERPITGAALEKATAAALEHTGGGRVTETEVGGDTGAEGYYEVEVTLPDGRQVDVRLDERFTVLGAEGSDAGER